MFKIKATRQIKKSTGPGTAVTCTEAMEFDVESITLNDVTYSGEVLEALIMASSRSKTILNQLEMADILGVSLPTMARYEKEGGMPVIRIGGCAPKYDRNKVFDWIDERQGLVVNF